MVYSGLELQVINISDLTWTYPWSQDTPPPLWIGLNEEVTYAVSISILIICFWLA